VGKRNKNGQKTKRDSGWSRVSKLQEEKDDSGKLQVQMFLLRKDNKGDWKMSKITYLTNGKGRKRTILGDNVYSCMKERFTDIHSAILITLQMEFLRYQIKVLEGKLKSLERKNV
jgi:hypothetical protein